MTTMEGTMAQVRAKFRENCAINTLPKAEAVITIRGMKKSA